MNNAAHKTITTKQGHVIVNNYFDETHRELTFTHCDHLRMVVTNEQAARLEAGHLADGGRVA